MNATPENKNLEDQESTDKAPRRPNERSAEMPAITPEKDQRGAIMGEADFQQENERK